MKKITLNEQDYDAITDYKNGFDKEETEKRYTDYFDDYDYIVGDWSYGKLRLKGFCDKDNKLYNKINDFELLDKYLKEECAYDCKYFVLKKTSKK